MTPRSRSLLIVAFALPLLASVACDAGGLLEVCSSDTGSGGSSPPDSSSASSSAEASSSSSGSGGPVACPCNPFLGMPEPVAAVNYGPFPMFHGVGLATVNRTGIGTYDVFLTSGYPANELVVVVSTTVLPSPVSGSDVGASWFPMGPGHFGVTTWDQYGYQDYNWSAYVVRAP